MSSSTIVLQDFIHPLPVCQYGVSWDKILNALRTSSCGTIAITDLHQNIIGTIGSHRALALFVRERQSKATVSVNLEQNSRQKKYCPTVDYSSLLDSVSIVNSNIDPARLLIYLRKDALTSTSSHQYIVVDSNTKSLGLLDVAKLANFLLFQSSVNSPEQELLNLLEKINLPLMLETDCEETAYKNHCWQKLVESNNPSKSQSNAINSATRHCLKGNSYLTFSDANSSLKNYIHREYFGFVRARSNCDLRPFPAEKHTWQYIKLPLDWQIETQTTNKTHYKFLVLAVEKTSLFLDRESKADKCDRLKDYLLANIGHEFKSPLTGIVGLSSLLQEEKLGSLNQRQINYVNLIHQGGRKLVSLVTSLLELTNLTTGKLKLNLESVEIKALCQEAYKQALQNLEKESSTQLTVEDNNFQLEIEPAIETAIADKVRLCQILSYLLVHALKYVETGERVGIRVGILGKCLTFTIWDDSSYGLASESRSSFIASLRSQTYLSDCHADIELQAILIQQLIEAHEGSISTIPRRHGKNEITLSIPYNLPPSTTNFPSNIEEICFAERAESTSSDRRKTPFHDANPLVLLVENKHSYIEHLTAAIQELGYRLIVAPSGIEAITKARQLQPKYIILDPILPALSGQDVLTLLKADSRTQDIPTFVIVAESEQNAKLYPLANGSLTVPVEKLALEKILPPINNEKSVIALKKLTILCLYPEQNAVAPSKEDNGSLNFNLKDWAEQDWTVRNAKAEENSVENTMSKNYRHRIIEADGLEQAEMLARIWQLDVIVLDSGQLKNPEKYLRSFAEYPALTVLPLITLDAKATAAANQMKDLNVYPCLVPANCRSIGDLMEVIQIAADIDR